MLFMFTPNVKTNLVLLFPICVYEDNLIIYSECGTYSVLQAEKQVPDPAERL